jgi:uncharacterized protein (TIGR02757 family)
MAAKLKLREGLEALRLRYDARYLSTDPVEIPRRYPHPEDREVVGFLAASLAYGNVATIRKSVERLLEAMGPRPAHFARTTTAKGALDRFRGFRHRWTGARDVAGLVFFSGRMIEELGSIGGFFRAGYVEGDIAESLLRFRERALALDHGGLHRGKSVPKSAGVRFFFPSPLTGAAKRSNMFLRWMARPDDGVDLGLWPFVPTRDLVIPLDTHIFRIGRHLGFTSRKTPSWEAAVEITRNLARFDPEDPVKYDFALSRLGILDGCPRHRKRLDCELCSLASGRRAA